MDAGFRFPLAESEAGSARELEDLLAREPVVKRPVARVKERPHVDPLSAGLQHGPKNAEEIAQVWRHDVDEPRRDDGVERFGDERRREPVGEKEVKCLFADWTEGRR